MTVTRYCALLVLTALALPAWSVIETYEFSSPEMEERYQALSAELRCPKCQNQNIADSNAPIAQDLRKQLYEQLNVGKDDTEIVDYMVQRYGEFVMYRPRWGLDTAVLWLAPVLLLCAAALVLFSTLRRGRTEDGAGDLTDDDSTPPRPPFSRDS